jgi:hypothetical protein
MSSFDGDADSISSISSHGSISSDDSRGRERSRERTMERSRSRERRKDGIICSGQHCLLLLKPPNDSSVKSIHSFFNVVTSLHERGILIKNLNTPQKGRTLRDTVKIINDTQHIRDILTHGKYNIWPLSTDYVTDYCLNDDDFILIKMITNEKSLRQLWDGKEEGLQELRRKHGLGHHVFPHVIHSMLVFKVDKPVKSMNKVDYYIKLLFCNQGCIGGGELLNIGLSLMKQLDIVIERTLQRLNPEDRLSEFKFTLGLARLTSTDNAEQFYRTKFEAEENERGELVINYRKRIGMRKINDDIGGDVLTKEDSSECIKGKPHPIDQIAENLKTKTRGGKHTQRKNKRKRSTRKKRRST